MTEPVRVIGRFVTITSKPGFGVTLEDVETAVLVCDESVERLQALQAALDAERLIHGPSVLREWLESYVAGLKAEEARVR